MKSILICSSMGSLLAALGVSYWVFTWKNPKDSELVVAEAAANKPFQPYFQAPPKSNCTAIMERPVWRVDRKAAKNTSRLQPDTQNPYPLELISISAGDAGPGFALIAKAKIPVILQEANKEESKKESKEDTKDQAESTPKKDPIKPAPLDEPAVLYALGDEIPGTGLTVASISADTVTLSGRNPQELKIDWSSAAVRDRLAAAAIPSDAKNEGNDKKANEEPKPKRDSEKNPPK